jgi:G:T-mismatch repair DNA endonuclease (very short patch repair protein)
MEEYVVITEYNDIAPICICGMCLETPRFNRGKFSKYAVGHEKFEFRESQYIKSFGEPTCLRCGKLTGFHRAIPKLLCLECSKTHQCKNGFVEDRIYHFQLSDVQNQIKKTVKEKYGVEFISQLPEIKEKIKESFTKNPKPPRIVTDETKTKNSLASKNNWKNPEFRKTTSIKLKIACNKPEERERRSRVQKEKWKAIKENNEPAPFYQSSKLHMSIREELNLSAYGFLSEQIIDWYVADELHPDRKIIIEINGDFWHANPDKYSENDIIKAPGESFVAGDKWKKDMEKYKKYVELGYELIVIWESDYKEDKTLSLYKERLSHLFGF